MRATTLRIDSRLVHGQVIEAWLPALAVDSIVVVDEDSAGNQLARAAMRLATPPEVSLTILGLGEAGADLLGNEHRVLLLVPSIEAAVRLVDRLHPGTEDLLVNVGVVHHSPGRRPITPGIHLSRSDLDMLSSLTDRGFVVEVRGLPSHSPMAVADARARYEKSSDI